MKKKMMVQAYSTKNREKGKKIPQIAGLNGGRQG